MSVTSAVPRVAARLRLQPPDDANGVARESVAATPPGGRVRRRVLLAVAASLVLACVLQRPGLLLADTKLPLVVEPGRFLGAALHLWDAGTDFGSLANQSVGYLFPMGAFFLAGHGLGLPPWLVERLWMAALLVAALWGTVRLAEAMSIGRPSSRVLGGLAYTLSPFMLSQLGTTSVGLLGAVMLPWMLLPLVLCARGSRPGLSPRRAAALSGVALLATGGVNGTVSLAVLVGPFLFLVLCCRGRASWRLRAWWLLAVVLAVAWWLWPLALQAKYGFDFLSFTETPAVTTSVVSAPEVLRGTGNWLALLFTRLPWLPAAWTYLVSPAVVLASAVVAAAGLAGLARGAGERTRALPYRTFHVTLLGVGLVLVGAGYSGQAGGLLGSTVRTALGGGLLGALRNVSKFEPLVLLPLALGLAHLLTARVPAPAGRRGRARELVSSAAAPGVAAVATLAALLVSATPLLVSRESNQGSFRSVPGYWRDAAAWLDAHAGSGRTLVLPGSAFGEYTWGRPLDEPLSWLSRTAWGTRSLVPLGGVGETRYLDGIETELLRGSAPGLAAVLARAGVSQVLVRNDLGRPEFDVTPSTAEVERALGSSGLVRVTGFGPLVAARSSGEQQLLRIPVAGTVPALQVWRVPGPVHLADSYPVSSAAVVSGGPEAVAQLAASGVTAPRALITASDLTAGRLPTPRTWLDTDTLQRRSVSYGQVHDNSSALLGPTERPADATGPVRQFLDVPASGHQTTSAYRGVTSVTASSTGFPLGATPDLAPFEALDGSPATAWQAAVRPGGDVGQWIQVELPTRVTLPYVTVRLLAEGGFRPAVTSLRVTTDAGSVLTRVRPDESVQRLPVAPGATRTLRVTFAAVSRATGLLGPGIRELVLPGVRPQRVAVAPSDLPPGPAPTTVAYAFSRSRTDPTAFLERDEEQDLARQFTVLRPVRLAGSGSAILAPDATALLPASGKARLGCGSGPVVVVDGHRYLTAVTAGRSDVVASRPVPFTVCAPGGLRLGSGVHTVTSPARPGVSSATDLLLATALPPTGTPRRTTVRSVSAERRVVDVGPGAASLLAVHENANASWRATLDGHTLAPVRLDGWEQGWVVPAGAGGRVVIENSAGHAMRAGLLLAAGLVLLLLVGAAVPGRAVPATAPAAVRGHRRGAQAAVVAGAAAVALLVSWPTVVLVPVLLAVLRLRPRLAPWLVAAGLALTGLLAAVRPGVQPDQHTGAFGPVGQMVATACVLVLVLALHRSRASSGQDGPARGPVAEPLP